MASQADENSPPRSDLVIKTRRQSMMDSPSRMTRSQSRRLSSAPAEAAMSPKPTATRRRSMKVPENSNDAASQDDVSSIQDDAEAMKPGQRSRRSTRRSFADNMEEGQLSTRGSKLSSIEEDSKPVTRRTRSSLKPSNDTDSELILPTTRRTRRSSVSSTSTIASSVVSPKRRTRAQKNLSPVPSPTFSEASVLSEIPEVSPNVKKRTSSGKDPDFSTSPKSAVTVHSSNASPIIESPGRSSGSRPGSAKKSGSRKDSSPMSKKGETLSAPRQLQLEDTETSKRSSLDSASPKDSKPTDITDSPNLTESPADSKQRKSRGRLSLSSRKSSPFKFVETPFQDSPKKVQEKDGSGNVGNISEGEPPAENFTEEEDSEKPQRKSGLRFSLSKNSETDHSPRDSTGRFSLSSRKSPEAGKVSNDGTSRLSVSALKSPSQEIPHIESVGRFSVSSIKTPGQGKSSRDSTGRFSVSPIRDQENFKRDSSGRLSLSKSAEAEKSRRDSTGRMSLSSKSPEPETLQRDLTGRLSLSKSAEAEKSRRDSTGRMSLSSKSPEPETLKRYSTGRLSLSSKSPELNKSQRSSVSRLSLSSNKLSPKSVGSSDSPSKSRSLSESSVPSAQIPSTKDSLLISTSLSQMSSTSEQQPLRKSLRKRTISPSKSSPGLSLKLDESCMDDSQDEDSESSASSDDEFKKLERTKSCIVVTSRSTPDSVIRDFASKFFSEKSVDSDKLKHRSSTGSLGSRQSTKTVFTSDANEGTSPLESKPRKSSGSENNSLSISNEVASPIKQDHSELKRLTLTPSSSEASPTDRQRSPNNPFEKSTVFDEIDESSSDQSASSDEVEELPLTQPKSPKLSDVQSASSEETEKLPHSQSMSPKLIDDSSNDQSASSEEAQKLSSPKKSPKHNVSGNFASSYDSSSNHQNQPYLMTSSLPKRKHSGVLSGTANQESSDQTESFSELNVESKKPRVSGKILKDAAYLLSGGNVSDYDDTDSDDNQWQLVFSQPDKSKKEMRMEKKNKRKAEKLAKLKVKAERVAHYKQSAQQAGGSENSISDDSQNLDKSPSSSITSPSEDIKIDSKSPPSDKKVNKSTESELNVSVKKRKSLEGNQSPNSAEKTCVGNDSYDELTHGNHVVDQDKPEDGPNSEGNISVKKKKKLLKAMESETILADVVIAPDDGIISGEAGSVLKKKKKKKLINSDSMLNEDEIVSLGSDNLKKKKKKAEKRAFVEDEPEDSSLTIKKKKKKLKKNDSDTINEQTEVAENISSLDSVALKKKKKLKKSIGKGHITEENLVQPDVSALEDVSTEHKKKKKKLKKNDQNDLETESDTVKQDEAGMKKKKKKSKKNLENEPGADGETIEVDEIVSEASKKKKSKKKKNRDMLDENQIIEEDNIVPVALKKKKKEKKLIETSSGVPSEHGSDSDDAPASVSFAAGKQTALAEIQAAVESIKKQKELKRQKLMLKHEKMKEQKLAKIEKLKQKKKKSKHLDVNGDNDASLQGVLTKGTASKIYFDEDGTRQKSEVKPPKRLPADLLESLSEQPPSKFVKRSDGTKEGIDASAELERRKEKKQVKKLAAQLKKKQLREAECVPLEGALGATRFGVVPLRNIMLAKKLEKNKLAGDAVNFRQETLFGNRIRRTPITSLISHQEKLRASGKDRLV